MLIKKLKIFKNYIINFILFNIFLYFFIWYNIFWSRISVGTIFCLFHKQVFQVVFIFIETIASYLDVYGVTFKILKISSLKFEGLNYKYIFSLVLNNSNYFIFCNINNCNFLRNKINFPKDQNNLNFNNFNNDYFNNFII